MHSICTINGISEKNSEGFVESTFIHAGHIVPLDSDCFTFCNDIIVIVKASDILRLVEQNKTSSTKDNDRSPERQQVKSPKYFE